MNQLLQKKPIFADNSSLELQLLMLPDWVYAPGFDSGLQTGYQFFLVKLEQISDVLFALHHLARLACDPELIEQMQGSFERVTEKIDQFFQSISQVLDLQKLKQDIDTFESEMIELEKQFNIVVPLSLELLDLKPEYVSLAEFIYCLKDLRIFLLKLGEALR